MAPKPSAKLVQGLREQLREVSASGYAKLQDEHAWSKLGQRMEAMLSGLEQGPPHTQLTQIYEAHKASPASARSERLRCAASLLRWTMTHLPADPPKKPAKARAAPSSSDDLRMRCVSTLPGIGPKTAQKLQERQLGTVGELLYFIPSAYIDRRQRKSFEDWQVGDHVVVEGKIQDFRQSFFKGRYMAKLTLQLDSEALEAPRLELRWFHRVYALGTTVTTGTQLLAVGVLSQYRGQWSMVHPEVALDLESISGVGVHYSAVKGVAGKTLSKAITKALEEKGFVDPLPESVRGDHLSQFEALKALHQPSETLSVQEVDDLNTGRSPAHARLAFDECFFLQLAAMLRRRAWQDAQEGAVMLCERGLDQETLRAALPFEPTGAQWRVMEEIAQDLAQGSPMLRLLQGDVGSGKTVVAFAAAMMVIKNRGQVALMAPTEILAKQHASNLASWCEQAGIRLALLTGSTRKAERESLLSLLAAGQIDLIVGTHALLVERVSFARLSLAVVDEQHRFGVEQRATLREKGGAPHLLVMTATPIPRSLALTAYGEMEVSVLDEMPPGRTPPVTRLYSGKGALQAARERLVRAAVDKQVQSFVVCPLVEQSDVLELSDVAAAQEALSLMMDPNLIAVVHGRMNGAQKDEAMRRFREREVMVLVATTVIEVGVDVPNAKIMLIEHAERFGLAQLHQLRGRIGRGSGPSLCMLHTASGRDSKAAQRLAVMEGSHDGFVIAEQDLAMRGPGEVFGLRQSGMPKLRFASFRREGLAVLAKARSAAKELVAQDPTLEQHPQVLEELRLRSDALGVCAAQAG